MHNADYDYICGHHHIFKMLFSLFSFILGWLIYKLAH